MTNEEKIERKKFMKEHGKEYSLAFKFMDLVAEVILKQEFVIDTKRQSLLLRRVAAMLDDEYAVQLAKLEKENQ